VALVTADAGNAAQDLVYAYRPSLLGAPWTFTLTDDGLRWSAGRRAGEMPYGAVRRVRLSYLPAKMQAQRFFTEIWGAGAPPLRIGSASWKSMFMQEAQNEQYVAFVTALHKRLARGGAPAVYVRGMNAFRYWLSFAVFALVAIGLVVMVARALQQGLLGGSLFIIAFLALFGWQVGMMLSRNRPGIYAPAAIPAALLPKSS
jgi:hypothetical protein